MARFDADKYIDVQERINRFWGEYPDGAIRTNIMSDPMDFTQCRYKAEVYKSRESPNPDVIGWAFEIAGSGGANQTSHEENCETSAIGRALANMGYATNREDRPSRQEMQKVQNVQQQQPPPQPIRQQQPPPQQYQQNQGFGGGRGAEEDINDQYQQQRNSPPPPPPNPPQQQQRGGGFSGARPSQKQMDYAIGLLNSKVIPDERTKAVAAFNEGDIDLNSISKQGISKLIEHLLTLPNVETTR